VKHPARPGSSLAYERPVVGRAESHELEAGANGTPNGSPSLAVESLDFRAEVGGSFACHQGASVKRASSPDQSADRIPQRRCSPPWWPTMIHR
jgi:hypothetical protein